MREVETAGDARIESGFDMLVCVRVLGLELLRGDILYFACFCLSDERRALVCARPVCVFGHGAGLGDRMGVCWVLDGSGIESRGI